MEEDNIQQEGKKRKKMTWGRSGFSQQVLAKALKIAVVKVSGAEGPVVQICFAQESFWEHLRDIQYVSMLTCVSKTIRNMLQPSGNMLPYWGVWTKVLRKHKWQVCVWERERDSAGSQSNWWLFYTGIPSTHECEEERLQKDCGFCWDAMCPHHVRERI